jgi:hypothetical protein
MALRRRLSVAGARAGESVVWTLGKESASLWELWCLQGRGEGSARLFSAVDRHVTGHGNETQGHRVKEMNAYLKQVQ